MIAIKSFPNHKSFTVFDGVMEDQTRFLPDGTFAGNAGFTARAVSRRFETLEQAQEAKAAYEEYAKKYQ